ncbi:MAG TPA: DNA/RNA non-specific endonuclease [Flavipsychrobacter sp.]|nr:DNA/RNA non-specific endonuclease [Flavipsychrobacter sp.]
MPSPSQSAFDKATLLACKGYDPKFIGKDYHVSCETVLPKSLKQYLPPVEGSRKGILHYSNLSVFYHAERKVPFFAAYNIDGDQKQEGIKRANKFRLDPRVTDALQLSAETFYNLRRDITEFEIGHMAANNELAWGENAQEKAYQTFHYPNSVPQAENLNTGVWKSLETYIINEAASIGGNKKICVFSGPIINDNDPPYLWDESFKIPLLFFKVVVFPTPQGLFATAFVMSHEKRMTDLGMIASKKARGLEVELFNDFKYKKVFQVDVSLVEEYTGLKFRWTKVKHLKVPAGKNQLQTIRKVGNADEAKDAEKAMKRGIAPEKYVVEKEVSAKSIENNTYKLNMVLPL